MSLRRPAAILSVVLLAAVPAYGQGDAAPAQQPPAWTFSASAYAYFVAGDTNYVQPTFTADRGRLHLEARYNYEELHAGSVWGGANFSGGGELEWEITPLVGVVAGDLTGIAPGYAGWLGWRRLELYSEGEYFIDEDHEDNFFYNWSELTLAAPAWFRFGLVTQRTRVYEADRELERGLVVGFSRGAVELTGYVFDPGGDSTTVLAASLEF
jgi:hypothetical protein